MGAGAEIPMKSPSLLLLLAVAAAPAFGQVSPKPRCDVAWLKAAQAVPAGGTISDPGKFLTTSADGKTQTIDAAKPTKLCDATVWHYLAVPATQQGWDKGLSEQFKILLSASEHYERVDALGGAALAKSEAVVKAAEASGVAARKDGATPAALEAKGYTARVYANEKGYSVSALTDAEAAAVASPEPAALKAAFALLIRQTDGKPARTVKNKAGKTIHVKATPPGEVKPGTAVLDFRKAVVALANELRPDRSAQAKSPFTDYAAALKFVTDPAISKADEDGAYPGAALSELDYGLRNLIALRAAAVDRSFAAAQARLHGQTLSAVLAAAAKNPQLPRNQSSANMAAAVLRHLQGIQDFKDLNTLYDNNKNNAAWMASDDGKAVAAHVEGMRKDAQATTIVQTDKGRLLQFSVGQQKVTDTGIAVADLDKSVDYREMIADVVARNIASNPLDARLQAALDAFRKAAPDGKVNSTPALPAGTVEKLPAVVNVTAPAPGSVGDYWATHPGGCAFLGLGCKSGAAKAVADENEALAAEAHRQMSDRARIEDAAENSAAAEVQARAGGLAAIQADQDPDLNKQAAIDAYNAGTKKIADAKKAAFLNEHKGDYLTADEGKAALDAQRKKDEETLDAAYSAGIAQSIQSLNGLYKAAKSDQRSYAEDHTSYKGQWYDKYAIQGGRVDLYFAQSWKDASAVEKCKAALGFKAGGDGSRFEDPGVENVDNICGVRDGVVKLLQSYYQNRKATGSTAAKK